MKAEPSYLPSCYYQYLPYFHGSCDEGTRFFIYTSMPATSPAIRSGNAQPVNDAERIMASQSFLFLTGWIEFPIDRSYLRELPLAELEDLLPTLRTDQIPRTLRASCDHLVLRAWV